MAIKWVCSMDQYGTAEAEGWYNPYLGGQPAGWAFDNDVLMGDAWAVQPSFTTIEFSYGLRSRPEGTYKLDVPSFGARQGDRALIADGPVIYAARSSGSGGTVTFPDYGAALMCAIPGSSQATRILHFAFAISELPTLDVGHGGIMDFYTDAGVCIARLKVNPSGRLALYSGATYSWNEDSFSDTSVELVTSSAPVISAGTWYSFNIQITADGDFDLWIGDIADANKVLTGSGLSFSGSGANIDILGFLPASAGGGGDISTDVAERAIRDVVICDTSGSYNNEPLGQVFVSAQEMRGEDAGGGWGTESRENFTTGILDSVTTSTGIYFSDVAAFDIGTQDFTLESMVRFNALPDATLSETGDIIARWDEAAGERSYRLYYDGATGALKFDISTDGSTVTTLKEIPWDVMLWKWYHVAVSRWTDTSGSYTSLFVDGVELGLPTADTNDYHDAAAPLGIAGRFEDDGGVALVDGTAFEGWLDETRVTVGTARYSAEFTPPSAAFGRNDVDDTDFDDVVILLGYETTIADESNAARVVNLDGTSPVTSITPDDNAYAYTVLNRRPPWDDTYIEATNYFAQSILTLTALPTASETVTIGAITYTFVAAVSSANDVLIGADEEETLTNLTAAVNGGSGEGTLYGTGTVANTAAVAVTYASPQLIIRSVAPGESAVATTETLANGYFDGATLSGGTDIPDDMDFAVERLPIDVTGVLGVQVTARANKTDAGSATMRFDFKGPEGGVATGTAFGPDLSPAWYREVFEEDPDTSSRITVTSVIGGRIRTKRVT